MSLLTVRYELFLEIDLSWLHCIEWEIDIGIRISTVYLRSVVCYFVERDRLGAVVDISIAIDYPTSCAVSVCAIGI